jgi:hypothetical protein
VPVDNQPPTRKKRHRNLRQENIRRHRSAARVDREVGQDNGEDDARQAGNRNRTRGRADRTQFPDERAIRLLEIRARDGREGGRECEDETITQP